VNEFDLTELIERIDTTVEECRNEADAERRNGVPRVESLIKLILALDDKFCLRLRTEDNDERIKLCREALSTTEQHRNEPLLAAQLSYMLSRALGAVEDRRYSLIRDHSHLDERLALSRSAVNAIPPSDARYLEALSELACALCQRPDLDRCQEAVGLQTQVLSCDQYNIHPLRLRLMVNAAACHYNLAFASKSVPTAQEAVALARKILDNCPKDHIERGHVCEIAARTLQRLFDLTSEVSLLHQRIEINQERLGIVIQTGQHLYPVYNGHSHSYRFLHEITGNLDALERAVEFGDLMVLHTPSDDRFYPMYVMSA
jgi:hypothetical protein